MLNKFPGKCMNCGKALAAGQGLCFKGSNGWQVKCQTPCDAKPSATEPPVRAEVGEVAGILALFAKAKTHLKRPAILLSVPALGAGAAIRLTIAGERAKVPGSLTVTDGTKDETTGRRGWLGRITLAGVYEPSPEAMDALAVPEITARLIAFAQEPGKIAGEHGKLTGRCCFCRIALTDERSTAVGYGPDCADHWNLPWGEKPKNFGEAA